MGDSGTIHKFEAAGLGKAPYTFKGVEKSLFKAGDIMKPGSSCDYCATPISNCYQLVSSDGNEFVVGSECIKKAGDKGLMKIVRRVEAQKRREKKRAKDLEIKAKLDALIQANIDFLVNKPHPSIPGQTYLDYTKWMSMCLGTEGKTRVYNKIVYMLDEANREAMAIEKEIENNELNLKPEVKHEETQKS